MTDRSALSYKGYTASFDFDADDELFTGRIAGINDVIGFHGESVTELMTGFRDAVDDYLETCAKVGKTPEKAYSGKVMLRVAPEVHALVALASQLSGRSINQLGEEALRDMAERLIPNVRDVADARP